MAIGRAMQAIQSMGRALPCSVVAINGSLVTVNFEVLTIGTLPQVTIPKAESPWYRMPTQVGDVGVTQPADTSLANIDGQGGPIPTLGTNYGNLSTLVWVPVSKVGLTPNPNPNQAWVYGPEGARLSDEAQTASVVASANLVTVTVGGKTWTFGPSGLTMSSGVIVETHIHGGVQTGAGVTGEPQA
jgi:hypothetical protein